ncbi:MAG: hypothetical protein IPM07_26965 [Anaerolineales bacterium]|nr:hypothetical protein [Anaerolineales bacterium]
MVCSHRTDGAHFVARPCVKLRRGDGAFDALLAAEQARGDIDEKCPPHVATHGQRTTRSIILFRAGDRLPFNITHWPSFYEQGCNVHVPRLPRHGYLDRTSTALADLTAEDSAAMMDATADLASGLGEEATMAGLSLGGNVSRTRWTVAR